MHADMPQCLPHLAATWSLSESIAVRGRNLAGHGRGHHDGDHRDDQNYFLFMHDSDDVNTLFEIRPVNVKMKDIDLGDVTTKIEDTKVQVVAGVRALLRLPADLAADLHYAGSVVTVVEVDDMATKFSSNSSRALPG